jgi:hypothetical protein
MGPSSSLSTLSEHEPTSGDNPSAKHEPVLNKKTRKRLVVLYAEMAEHTNKLCAACSGPSDRDSGAYGCCSVEHCEITMAYAKEAWGVDLEPVNIHMPLLGSEGCIAAPHLRPSCSVWTCALGDPGYTDPAPDAEWRGQYAELRGRIDRIDDTRSLVMDIAWDVFRQY